MSASEIQDVSTMMANLRAYYLEVSVNSLTLDIDYLYNGGTKSYPTALAGTETPYTMANSMEAYGIDAGGTIDLYLSNLVKEAINSSGAIKGSPYDTVVIIHSGYGQESTGKSGDIWSQFLSVSPATNNFTEAVVMPVKESKNAVPFGVFCHEFGHQLGLPDLYNTSTGGTSFVGYWCLMDYGTWLGTPTGSKPAHPSIWCKKQLGWVTPTITSGTNTLTVNNIEQNKTNAAYQFTVLNSTTEYFLLEYRKKHLYDTDLPGEGILIWHIDDSIGTIDANDINNSESHPRVKLMEADKDNALVKATNHGLSSDVFNKSSDIFSMPESNSYGNASSGITIAGFSGVSNNAMAVSTYVLASSTDLQVKKVFGFPNPSRNGQSVRIRSVFTRPITSGNIKMYNVAGELVKEDSITSSNITISASKDYEWAYEYIWDLTNSSGNIVSTGVYIYIVEATITDAAKQTSIGKVAIIR
jgi:M6 family metalloprotease-like protein